MNWNWDIVTAAATLLYAISFLLALRVAYLQLDEFQRSRKREAVLAIFQELQVKEARDARRYIYEEVPQEIRGVEDRDLKKHLLGAEQALTSFSRIEYMLQEGHIDPEPLLDAYWQAVWRCWKKSKRLIWWAREKRGEQTYLRRFENLFYRAEAHRINNNREEPKIH